MKDNLSELKATLEEIRKKEYPDIPQEVIEKIITEQFNHQDNPGKRQSETLRVITEFANKLSSTEG